MRLLLVIGFLLTSLTGFTQDCPNLIAPAAGATNVPVDSPITWEEVVGVTGYIISLGTTPGGGEIVANQPVGSVTTYNPPLGLPESTTIYVTITLFFFDQPDIICEPISFTTRNEVNPPSCTQLNAPVNGSTGVNVGANLSWNYAPRATGYRLTIGTAPGLGDIALNLDVGNVLSYNPPADFPAATEIFVQIVPYNENGIASSCIEESFITGDLGDPPGCTMLINPVDGQFNVALSPLLEWEPVPGATGYLLYIGRSPFENDVVDGAIFTDTSTFVFNFEPNNTYFVRIVPFNDAGQAVDCPQESFSTILGCGPFFDEDTGELVVLNPEISFPDIVGICLGQTPRVITATDPADGYRWYRVTDSGDLLVISEEATLELEEMGTYVYEAYVLTDDGQGSVLECSSSSEFTVVASQEAQIDDIFIRQVGEVFNVEVVVSGIGEYEYALAIDGPYQDSPEFNGLTEGNYVLYIRDRNGCGIVQRPFRLLFPPTGFPPYFSPNGDGVNDLWNYVPPRLDPLPLKDIYIYDRYGKLLARINPNGNGWNGQYRGNPLPAAGYWYRAETFDNQVFRGFFSLVR